jgi:methionyl-tRNA formyltransferase
MSENTYIVAAAKSWNRKLFEEEIIGLPGTWFFVSGPDDLDRLEISDLSPRYIFFLHWSWKVPNEIIDNFECVCFHMTDVPYGRGGSPLQNLILQGHKRTKLTALRMNESLDAGPVYIKKDLCLGGNAEDIYIRASNLAVEMMYQIIREEPEPVPQSGKPTIFKRRRPDQSEIKGSKTLREMYDFIRMLDAEGYPRAFLEHDGYRFEFSRVSLYDGRLVADVEITELEERS